MTQKICFKTSPEVCSRAIEIELNDDIIQQVKVIGGCPGNAIGLGRLAVGYCAAEVVKRLSGVRCGAKSTSCPDQLAQALQQLLDR